MTPPRENAITTNIIVPRIRILFFLEREESGGRATMVEENMIMLYK